MNIIAIIPARMGSSRFPGKPLADIHGIPMVGHVTIRTAMCKELSSTWIATCRRAQSRNDRRHPCPLHDPYRRSHAQD